MQSKTNQAGFVTLSAGVETRDRGLPSKVLSARHGEREYEYVKGNFKK